MAIVKKIMKSKRWPRNGCDGIGWWQKFNDNNSGQFVQVSLGISTKFT